jgi:hypothetical protein
MKILKNNYLDFVYNFLLLNFFLFFIYFCFIFFLFSRNILFGLIFIFFLCINIYFFKFLIKKEIILKNEISKTMNLNIIKISIYIN